MTLRERLAAWLPPMLVRWFKGLWTRERPVHPVLLRVTDADGTAPFLLDVSSRWLPSGRVIERSLRTADGLCVVHWLAEADEVELTVRSSLGAAILTVLRVESRGRTIAVSLTPPAVLAPSPRHATSASAG